MKIKEVQVGIKVTKNYDSYQASLAAELETNENPEKIGAELMEKASAIVNEKMNAELNKKSTPIRKAYDEENEVGAAWPDKKFKDRLSVKYSGTDEWKEISAAELEKTDEGYRQKTGDGAFIFRKIPEKKRTNDKMPTYRIYKIEE